ncbi:zinc finger protein 184-like [Cimex lectularius]|uniref:C2H2-type domain-containing protein n=1 Tax=Cimex lectularius TaxID=79782 RepID=A0A8I6S372_CIMLE|nr:zinc finger protein 184-like [Cimex lectularius]
MNQSHPGEYRATLHQHQLHRNQCTSLQTFARFPSTGLNVLNAVVIPGLSVNQEDGNQYQNHIHSFLNSNRTSEQQHQNLKDHQKNGRGYEDPTTSADHFRHCNQGPKNCQQCYTKAQQQQPQLQQAQQTTGAALPLPLPQSNPRPVKIMVDASTMTDSEESLQSATWQNPAANNPNTKVAEYLTSLRQFLKLSTPSETKRKLGDVRIVISPDGSRLYCCPECHMAYPDKNLLEPHLASHKIERRFVCGVCGAGLKRKEHLDRHQLSHSDERPYSCAACPKTFKRNEHLARHYIIHSGEKAQMERRFVCGVCGTGHARREHLERHQLAHTEDRPHACTTCRKTFKRNEHLARHLLTHSGLKPHICLECGKAFYRKDHLRKHLLAHQTKRIRLAGITCNTKLSLTLP